MSSSPDDHEQHILSSPLSMLRAAKNNAVCKHKVIAPGMANFARNRIDQALN